MNWPVIGLSIALAVTVGWWRVEVANLRADHATAISAEEKKTRDVQGQWDAYKLQVEQTISNGATDRARALSAALDRASELQAEVDGLRSLYAQATVALDVAESERVRELNNAKKDQDSLLDARTRAYYGRLRSEQLAATKARSDSSPP